MTHVLIGDAVEYFRRPLRGRPGRGSPKSTTPWLLPALLAAAVCAGCGSLAEDVANDLAAQDVHAIDQDFTVVEGDLALFRKCLVRRGGSCQGDPATPLPHSSQHHDAKPVTPSDPGGSWTLADSVATLPAGHPAKIAHEVLSHPVTRQAAALHNHLRGHDAGSTAGVSVTRAEGAHGGPESTVAMDLKLDQTRHFHGRLLASLGTGAWDALDGHCRDLLKTQQGAPAPNRAVTDRLEADCRCVAFVRGYLGAYLRHGEFVEVDAALTKLRDEVKGFDPQLVRELDDELDKTNKALSNVFKVSKVGFLSRDATFQARLPTIEVALDPTVKRLLTFTDADTGQILTTKTHFGHLGVASDTSGVGTGAVIGAELVRVFLEAIFDAHEGLPAVAPANLGGVKPTGLTLGRYSLSVFQSPTGDIDGPDLTRMTDLNDAVALKTRLLVGRIISGVGPFSLNNPALEHLIIEIVATSVRKAVEKASWCWYACNLNVEVAKLSSDVGKAVEDRLSAEEKKLRAAIEAGDRDAWSWADREAEHVKLRLKLSK